MELEKKELTAREIGRMGGLSTKERHGREHFIRMGQKAAEVLKQRYGQAHYVKMAEARRRKKNESSNANVLEEERPSMPVSEAGRKGGKTVLERYGSTHFVEAGRKGGSTTRERYGSEHYSRIGRIGGKAKARNRSQESNPPSPPSGGEEENLGGVS